MNSESKKSNTNLRSSVKDTNNNKKDPTDSTNALFLLAEVRFFFFYYLNFKNLAELVDSVSKSEDKEKFLPTLQAVWANTLPYLKAKKYFF